MKNYLLRMSEVGSKSDPGILYKAWDNLYKRTSPRQRAISCGLDDETIEIIKKNEVKCLREISLSIKSEAGYSFTCLKPVPIKKPNGKYRIICIPTVRDRIVQKAIQLAINEKRTKYTQFNGVNFGFIRNYGVKNAIDQSIRLRNENGYVYKTDISAFFDNIDRSKLKKEFRSKIAIPSLFSIIDDIIDLEIFAEDKGTVRKIKDAGIITGKGVRQGMPLSPLFANIYLDNLDRKLVSKSIKAVRYADDVIIFANSIAECKSIDLFIRNELTKIGLEVPSLDMEKSKTRIYTPEQTVEYLGIGLKYSEGKYVPIVTDEQKEEIKKSIFKFSDISYLNSRNITLPKLYATILATIKGYDGVYLDCYEFATFSNTMRQWQKSAIRDLLIKNFGIDLYKLKDDQIKFLTGIEK